MRSRAKASPNRNSKHVGRARVPKGSKGRQRARPPTPKRKASMSNQKVKKQPDAELFPVEETVSPELEETRRREDDRLKKEKEDSKAEAAGHQEYTERLCNENPGLRE